MIKQLLKQIWSQRSKNGWIYLELFIVFILLWYILDYGFMMAHNRLMPRGFDIENTYRVFYKDIKTEEDRAKFEQFVQKVKQFPGVESVFITDLYSGVTPFSLSYSGSTLKADTAENAVTLHAQRKNITSDNYFEVFKIKSAIHPDQAPRLDFSNSSSIVISEDYAQAFFGDEDPIGKSLYFSGNNKELIVSDVVKNQKKDDYQTYSPFILLPASENKVSSPEIAMRVNQQFSEEDFRDQVASNMISYKSAKWNLESMEGTRMNIQLRLLVMLFFALSTAVGVLGTFWFRNQARRGEIGLRMSMGSSRREILKHFVSEALLLLTLAAIPAMIIVAIILKLDIIEVVGLNNKQGLYLTENIWLRGAITVAITYLFMALVVALSAWIPAYRASTVNPVDALRDE